MSEGVVDEHEMIEGINFAGTVNMVLIVNRVVESANTIGAISQASQPPTRLFGSCCMFCVAVGTHFAIKLGAPRGALWRLPACPKLFAGQRVIYTASQSPSKPVSRVASHLHMHTRACASVDSNWTPDGHLDGHPDGHPGGHPIYVGQTPHQCCAIKR